MGRIQDFNFHDNVPLRSFKDVVRRIINFGKYSIPEVSTPPSWSAEPGEAVLLVPSSGGMTQYIYHGSAWYSTWSISF